MFIMNLHNLVSDILRSYDFSQKRSEKIYKRLYHRILRKDISGCDEVYEYVADYLDKLTCSRRLKYSERNDFVENRENLGTLEDNDSLENLDGQNNVRLKGVLKYLKDKVGSEDYGFLKKLVKSGDFNMTVNLKKLDKSLEEIKNRLSLIRGAFYVDGRVFIPLKEIRFFYDENFRVKIGNFDSRLVARVYGLHSSGKVPSVVGKEVNLSPRVIKELWEDAGLEVTTRKRNTRKLLLEADNLHLKNSEMAKHAGISKRATLEHRRVMGLKIGKSTKKLDDNEIARIRESYETKFNWNVRDVAYYFNRSVETIRKYLDLKNHRKSYRSHFRKTS